MTSLATLILKLNQLTSQSEFYLSQYLGALIHLPRVWRNLHAELHLTTLTLTILQLTRQLRMSSLIRIGAPPLLKLTAQTSEMEDELQPTKATLPLDLPKLQKPLTVLRQRATGSPKPLQAITRTLFQTGAKTQRAVPMQSYSGAKSETLERTSTSASVGVPLPIYLPLKDEAPAEESLREKVVERWLQQQEETGRRPMMSFVEAHKLYRDMFEEFVATSILTPYLFAERFLETPHNLTFEQARTDLRVRLNATPPPGDEGSNMESQPETKKQIPSILLPSYITSTLWAKGSLAFGGPQQSKPPSLLRLTPSTPDVSSRFTPSIFSEVTQRGQAVTPHALESSIAPPNRIYHETKDHAQETNFRDLQAETNPTGTPPIKLLPTEEPSPEAIHPERELEPAESYSEDRHLATSPDHSKQNLRVYSPAAALYSTLAAHTITNWPRDKEPQTVDIRNAGELAPPTPPPEDHHLTSSPHAERDLLVYTPAAALYSTLAAHATTAFISPTHGNGHKLPSTSLSVALKPPLALDRIPQTPIHPHTGPLPAKTEEPIIERIERILPIAESHPTPLYLRPPMNSSAIMSASPQRIPATTLPPPNIAATRETRGLSVREREEELTETSALPEGYPENEDESEDAAVREQLKRMGKLIAEEARRHIGSD